MRIRSKLVLSFLCTLIVAWLIIGPFLLSHTRQSLIESSKLHFETLAETNSRHLQDIVEGQQRVLGSIISKWQLRRSFREYLSGNPDARNVMQTILEATRQQDPLIRSITILTPDFNSVLTVGEEFSGILPDKTAEIYWPNSRHPVLVLAGPLSIENENLGQLQIEIWANDLFDLLSNLPSLGDTGEILLFKSQPTDSFRLLTLTRFNTNAMFNRVFHPGEDNLALFQLTDTSKDKTETIRDYRGEPVLVATHHLPDLGWFVVVKQDLKELLAPLDDLQFTLPLLLATVALVAGLVVAILARRITSPLIQLAQNARAVRLGESQAIPVSHAQDETGMLSRSLQHMIDKFQESSRLLNSVMDLSPAIIFVKDEDGRYLMANEQMAKMYDETPEGLVGKLQSELHPNPDELTAFRTNDLQAINSGKSRESIREEFTDIQGVTHILHTYKVPFIFEDKPVVLGMAMDITELAQAEEKAHTAEVAAEVAIQSNSAKSRFLANMSHEIRTPMNSVLGFLDLVLENSDLPAEPRRQLTIAKHSARMLLDLINDILDIAKLENGRMELEEIPFSLRRLTEEILLAFEIQTREKGLQLFSEIAPEVPETWLGDPTRIRQILINLVGNAVKFTEEGQITLSISRPNKTGELTFCVTDTGIGISEERQSELMKPFTQADTSTTRRFGGTGLGLSISKQLIEMMNGTLTVTSEPGTGSTFVCSLTLKEAAAGETPIPQTSNAMNFIRPAKALNILLAEDIEENIELARTRLMALGHNVRVARNGLDAVILSAQEPFDLILMDIQMPKLDGLEATRQIRQYEAESQQKRVPIIALTASVMLDERKEYAMAGMDDFAAKPIDFPRLFQQIASLTDGKPAPALVKQRKHEPDARYPGFNYEEGVERCLSPELYAQMLTSFLESYERMIDQIDKRFQQGDMTGVHELSHALKGVAGNLSVTEVFTLCSDLAVAAKHSEKEECQQLIEALHPAMKKACRSVRELIGDTETLAVNPA
ncbi:ATP-binding protein [Aestuariispira insulae]|uniref:histidine kinase n=1 Tax=Aestuariispira insulae TaxID=1461337 RepID=A0A3D9H5G3_9PROT|nr:ATP-binding protein [Aestuariispira insulae]RED44206.1 PAS domain S-box-containing protein [Aestuariispira insulae]